MSFSYNLLRNIILSLLVVLALLVLLWGYGSGRKLAVAKFNLAQADQVSRALHKFFVDQERYPSSEEYASPDGLGRYLSSFPPKFKQAGKCEQGAIYTNRLLQDYSFEFCLPAKVGNFAAGLWRETSSGGVVLSKGF